MLIHVTDYLAIKQMKVCEEEQANGQVLVTDRHTGLATMVSTMLLEV